MFDPNFTSAQLFQVWGATKGSPVLQGYFCETQDQYDRIIFLSSQMTFIKLKLMACGLQALSSNQATASPFSVKSVSFNETTKISAAVCLRTDTGRVLCG